MTRVSMGELKRVYYRMNWGRSSDGNELDITKDLDFTDRYTLHYNENSSDTMVNGKFPETFYENENSHYEIKVCLPVWRKKENLRRVNPLMRDH